VPIQYGAAGDEREGLNVVKTHGLFSSLAASPVFAAALSPKPYCRAWWVSHEIDRSGAAGIGIRLLISDCWHAG
jgi:hypothetical protein